MKTLAAQCIAAVLALCLYGLIAPPLIRGQGLVYLSNTNQPVAESSLTGSFNIGFTTGSDSAGYLLNSVTILFANNNTPVIVSAGLDNYSTITSFGGAAEVGAAGYYTFTPTSPITLAANTSYALLIYPDDSLVDINSSDTTSSVFTSIDNWNIPGLDGSEEPLFAITATPIEPTPEPTATSLACASISVFIAFRMWIRRRTASPFMWGAYQFLYSTVSEAGFSAVPPGLDWHSRRGPADESAGYSQLFLRNKRANSGTGTKTEIRNAGQREQSHEASNP
jgi:hypothetical protein